MLPQPGTESGLDAAPTLVDVALLPMLLTVVGVIIWFYGWRKGREGRKSPIKWFGVVVLGAAAIIASGPFLRVLTDQPYMKDVVHSSRRLLYMGFYPSFVLPVILIIGFVAWHFYDQKMGQYR